MLTRGFFPSVFRSSFRPRTLSDEFRRIQDEMNRLFSGSRYPAAAEYPALNVWSNDVDTVITAELPGIEPDDIQLSVVQNTLTLRGERKAEELKEGESYHRRERREGKFVRTLELPFEVDGDKVEAAFTNGVLSVKLPRAEAHRPKKIEISRQPEKTRAA
jgi:HSP20 family protein